MALMRIIVQSILDGTGWTQAELADRLDTTQVTVSRWLSGAEPRGDMRDKIRELAGELGIIDEPPRTGSAMVPVMGFIGAGAEIEPEYAQIPPEGLEQVEVPFALPDDVFALKVVGTSQRPIYNDGDIILVRQQPRRTIDRMIGDAVALQTSDGKRYVKHVMRGRKRGTYTLLSYNDDPIEDVHVVWASEIVGIVPARETRILSVVKGQRR